MADEIRIFISVRPLRYNFYQYQSCFDFYGKIHIVIYNNKIIPVDTGHKFNVHKTFRRRPGHLLNVLRTFNLRLVCLNTA